MYPSIVLKTIFTFINKKSKIQFVSKGFQFIAVVESVFQDRDRRLSLQQFADDWHSVLGHVLGVGTGGAIGLSWCRAGYGLQ